MGVLFTLLIVIAVSMLVVRIGTVALTMTGLARDVAAFQAQSAFAGVGFTTSESEAITAHPVRRRICRILMLMGTAGLSSTVASLVATFATAGEGGEFARRLAVVVGGIAALFLLSNLRVFNLALNWVIRRALAATTQLRLQDYHSLLQMGEGYTVSEIPVKAGHWMEGQTLRGLNLTAEGVVVLGVRRRKGHLFTTPTADTLVQAGDDVICYGREELLSALAARQRDGKGAMEHDWAVEHARIEREAEIALDERYLQETALQNHTGLLQAVDASPQTNQHSQGEDGHSPTAS
jgi:hypothetical protein